MSITTFPFTPILDEFFMRYEVQRQVLDTDQGMYDEFFDPPTEYEKYHLSVIPRNLAHFALRSTVRILLRGLVNVTGLIQPLRSGLIILSPLERTPPGMLVQDVEKIERIFKLMDPNDPLVTRYDEIARARLLLEKKIYQNAYLHRRREIQANGGRPLEPVHLELIPDNPLLVNDFRVAQLLGIRLADIRAELERDPNSSYFDKHVPLKKILETHPSVLLTEKLQQMTPEQRALYEKERAILKEAIGGLAAPEKKRSSFLDGFNKEFDIDLWSESLFDPVSELNEDGSLKLPISPMIELDMETEGPIPGYAADEEIFPRNCEPVDMELIMRFEELNREMIVKRALVYQPMLPEQESFYRELDKNPYGYSPAEMDAIASVIEYELTNPDTEFQHDELLSMKEQLLQAKSEVESHPDYVPMAPLPSFQELLNERNSGVNVPKELKPSQDDLAQQDEELNSFFWKKYTPKKPEWGILSKAQLAKLKKLLSDYCQFVQDLVQQSGGDSEFRTELESLHKTEIHLSDQLKSIAKRIASIHHPPSTTSSTPPTPSDETVDILVKFLSEEGKFNHVILERLLSHEEYLIQEDLKSLEEFYGEAQISSRMNEIHQLLDIRNKSLSASSPFGSLVYFSLPRSLNDLRTVLENHFHPNPLPESIQIALESSESSFDLPTPSSKVGEEENPESPKSLLDKIRLLTKELKGSLQSEPSSESEESTDRQKIPPIVVPPLETSEKHLVRRFLESRPVLIELTQVEEKRLKSKFPDAFEEFYFSHGPDGQLLSLVSNGASLFDLIRDDDDDDEDHHQSPDLTPDDLTPDPDPVQDDGIFNPLLNRLSLAIATPPDKELPPYELDLDQFSMKKYRKSINDDQDEEESSKLESEEEKQQDEQKQQEQEPEKEPEPEPEPEEEEEEEELTLTYPIPEQKSKGYIFKREGTNLIVPVVKQWNPQFGETAPITKRSFYVPEKLRNRVVDRKRSEYIAMGLNPDSLEYISPLSISKAALRATRKFFGRPTKESRELARKVWDENTLQFVDPPSDKKKQGIDEIIDDVLDDPDKYDVPVADGGRGRHGDDELDDDFEIVDSYRHSEPISKGNLGIIPGSMMDSDEEEDSDEDEEEDDDDDKNDNDDDDSKDHSGWKTVSLKDVHPAILEQLFPQGIPDGVILRTNGEKLEILDTANALAPPKPKLEDIPVITNEGLELLMNPKGTGEKHLDVQLNSKRTRRTFLFPRMISFYWNSIQLFLRKKQKLLYRKWNVDAFSKRAVRLRSEISRLKFRQFMQQKAIDYHKRILLDLALDCDAMDRLELPRRSRFAWGVVNWTADVITDVLWFPIVASTVRAHSMDRNASWLDSFREWKSAPEWFGGWRGALGVHAGYSALHGLLLPIPKGILSAFGVHSDWQMQNYVDFAMSELMARVWSPVDEESMVDLGPRLSLISIRCLSESSLVASLSSGIVRSILYPLVTLKNLLLVPGNPVLASLGFDPSTSANSAVELAKLIYSTRGLAGFYTGFSAHLTMIIGQVLFWYALEGLGTWALSRRLRVFRAATFDWFPLVRSEELTQRQVVTVRSPEGTEFNLEFYPPDMDYDPVGLHENPFETPYIPRYHSFPDKEPKSAPQPSQPENGYELELSNSSFQNGQR